MNTLSIFLRPQRYSRSVWRLILVAMLGTLVSCATNPVSGGRDFVLMSEESEISEGKKSHGEIMKQYEVYDDPGMTALVNRLGQELAEKSHRNHLNYTFTVLDSPEVNAFALPGGYIYITRGIIAYLNSEEALAGVIGHEIGHVTARHGVKQQSASFVSTGISILAAIATGSNQAAQAANTIGGALVSGYGRNHELQADRLGAEYLAKSGYDPEQMLDVIGVLKNQELFSKAKAKDAGKQVSSYHGVFSSHPANDQRLQEVVAAAKKFQIANPRRTDRTEFLRVQDRMIYGHSEEQGVVVNNNFYHKGLNLAISFPKGWQLQNQPASLTGVGPKQQNLMQMVLGEKDAREPKAYLKKAFPKYDNLQRLKPNAYAAVVNMQSPWGTKPGRVATVKEGDQMLVLMAAGKDQPPKDKFIQMVKSVRGLNSKERSLATARKIKLIRARSGDTFARLADGSRLGKYAVDELRLINGLYPSGEPKAGDLIKVVE